MGTIRYPDGDEFTGQFKEGLKSGAGVYKYSNKDELRGCFSREQLHGGGNFQLGSAGGVKFSGQWRRGQRCGPSAVQLPGDDCYELNWDADKPLWNSLLKVPNNAEELKS
jgi:hypothetical protein